MKLCDPIGIWFSELENNWDEREFHHESIRFRKTYRHYGDLPDGFCYGTVFFEGGDSWPPAVCITITDQDGNALQNSAVSEDWRTWQYKWPEAAAASPSGRSLLCLIDGRLCAWRKDKEGFVSDNGSFLDERLDNLRVRDALMQDDGILIIKLEDDTTRGYLCDADTILLPSADGWIAKANESWKIADARKEGLLDSCPETAAVVINGEESWGEYDGTGVHKVFIAPETERIAGCVLADNPQLKTVIIPASVIHIEWGAFLNCVNLKELIIEGDLSRVTAWDKGAFEGCPCEEYYLSLRDKNS